MPQTRQAGRALESLSLGVESELAVLEGAEGAFDAGVREAGVLPEGNDTALAVNPVVNFGASAVAPEGNFGAGV